MGNKFVYNCETSNALLDLIVLCQKSRAVLEAVKDGFFGHLLPENGPERNRALYDMEASYPQAQMLVTVIDDYLFEMCKLIKTIEET